ncbi:hypothetical protein QVD17_32521 [Tagetes erecta]|uniref:Uncharacterized protein n=1 Tax=Tagetes erecta TaxID=13708 RepID=A0AAD8NJC4_TARER|nr:hypothetical protein QVD17_32521 [Tagetes erecta]
MYNKLKKNKFFFIITYLFMCLKLNSSRTISHLLVLDYEMDVNTEDLIDRLQLQSEFAGAIEMNLNYN